MCGRYLLDMPGADVAQLLHALDRTDNAAPTWNAAPSQLLPVLGFNPDTRERSLVKMEWGLVPQWAADAGQTHGLSSAQRVKPQINARGETLAERPMFRTAFSKRRCLVPMRGWYEWVRGPDRKHPWVLQPVGAEEDIATAAGLWERWRSADGTVHDTFAIVTCEAAPEIHHLHSRQPVLIGADDRQRWLETPASSVAELHDLLRAGHVPIEAWEVDTAVNAVSNNSPDIVRRIAE